MLPLYKRPDLILSHGEGAHLFDTSGNRYLDLVSGVGVNALGYNHPSIVQIIHAQAPKLLHSSNLFHHAYAPPLATKLAEWSGLPFAFFINSGAEAIETALKAVRAADPSRRKIVSIERGFHGRTFGALSVTGQAKYRRPFEPLPGPVTFIPANDCAALQAALTPDTLAVVCEVVQGEGGVVPLTEEFLTIMAERTQQFGSFWIADETQCGLGRTGHRFAYQHFPHLRTPDLVTTAKPLGGGLPLGVTLLSSRFEHVFAGSLHGSTFGGGPLACRVAIEVLDQIEALLPEVTSKGELLLSGLRQLQASHDVIRQVRGRGLMAGIELSVPAQPFVDQALEHGLILNVTQNNVIRLLPPYVISQQELQQALALLEATFCAMRVPA